MRKTIICVRGQPNSGKTSGITLAHEMLLSEGESIYSNTRADAAELKEVVEIDGVLIGFASAGDKPDRLARSLRFLLSKGCVVIVCAARLNRSGEAVHSTIDAVERFARENDFTRKWIDKERCDHDRDNADRELADEIVARVRGAIQRAQLVEA